jgi:energy-coupling factor transporter ATP-binding protein EcfA2
VLLVVGPSGSGKSTLARGIAGLLPTEFPGEWQGSLRLDDRELATADAPPLPSTTENGAGIVFQDPASQLVMERVGDDVAFGLENLAWPLAAMRRRVPEALSAVGLGAFDGRRSTRLSGGEQQRVAIAGVLAPSPRLLVLDEPTANLDPDGAAVVARILRSLRDQRAATIVLVEHRASLAWPLADVVLAMGEDGRPIDVGSPSDVLARSGATLKRAGIWLPEAGGRRESSVTADDGRLGRGGRPGAAPGHSRREGDAGRDAPASRWLVREGLEQGSPPILELRDVRFAFDGGEPVLRDIDLTVAQGDRVALVGPNGSGKTTLLRLALGLLRPLTGEIDLGSRDPWRLPPAQIARLAGYVVQDPELGFLGDSVREEVELGLEPQQLGFAHELCERLALPLESFGDRSPYRLSGGEQRRLSLVTGLARRPLLLALDEPTYGQDRRGHDALVAALDELVEQGSALLAATHDEAFVRDATNRRIELAGGWIVAKEALEVAVDGAADAHRVGAAASASPRLRGRE